MHTKCWLVASVLTIFIYTAPITHSQEFNATEVENYVPWQQTNVTDYQPANGDFLTFYLPAGKGYIANEITHTYSEFPILSGQPKNVYYLRHYYYAATPEQEWSVKSMDIKRDRITFGKTGRFFRLYEEDTGTPYGIHTFKSAEKLMEKGKLYASMGCVIVPEEVLNVIENSFTINEKDLKVTTTSNFDKVAGFMEI